jgi:hypothetical protein
MRRNSSASRETKSAWVLALSTLALLTLLRAQPGRAADSGAAAPQTPLSDLTRMLSGNWRCSGHFANGKLITSAESFAPLFAGRWLVEEHVDDPPFPYRARSMWGWDEASHLLTLTIFDNFGGARLFTSGGWQDSALVFDERPLINAPAHQERFIYERLPAGGYSVEYQVLEAAKQWRMGDVLACTGESTAAG